MVDAKVLEAVNFFSSQIRNNGIRINNLTCSAHPAQVLQYPEVISTSQ
ncbi:MAG: hypothetical protein WCJ93_11520 [Methanomicrobiales archaeon]